MSISNRELVERYLSCYNEKDVEAVLSLFAENAVFESVSNMTGVIRTTGKEELRRLALKSVDYFEQRRQTPVAWVVDETHVAVQIDYWCRLAKDLPAGHKAGVEMQLRGASFFTIQDGRITRLVDYMRPVRWYNDRAGAGFPSAHRRLEGDGNMRDEGRSKKQFKTQYAAVASQETSGGGERSDDPFSHAKSIGYSEQEMRSVPAEAAVTHGCGNPTALAQLKPGQVVLDLGCGGGLDAFLAARRVGPEGRVIGLDMTPEMVEKATASARKGGYTNVDFRVAEIKTLPVADDSVDVVISNCVINHALDKPAVFREVCRVLKAGGSMLVSDLVTTGPFPDGMVEKVNEMWVPWLTVASDRQTYLKAIQQGGFHIVTVLAEGLFPMAEADAVLRGRVLSIQIRADK